MDALISFCLSMGLDGVAVSLDLRGFFDGISESAAARASNWRTRLDKIMLLFDGVFCETESQSQMLDFTFAGSLKSRANLRKL